MEITIEQIKEVIADQLSMDVADIKDESLLQDDLGAGSFDMMDLVTTFEQEYGIVVDALDYHDLKTVNDIFLYVKNLLAKQS